MTEREKLFGLLYLLLGSFGFFCLLAAFDLWEKTRSYFSFLFCLPLFIGIFFLTPNFRKLQNRQEEENSFKPQ